MAASAGWGYIDTAIKSVDDPTPSTVVVNLKYPWAPLLADLSLFANGIVPNNYGGQTEAQFYHATRSAPARSSGTTGTRARRSSWCATRSTGRRASPT